MKDYYKDLDNEQQECVGSYADNCHTSKLIDFIDNYEELNRLNTHRNEKHGITWFNHLIKTALKLRLNI